MKAAFLAIALVGCVDQQPTEPTTLPHNERYSMTLPYYPTPEECLAVNAPVARLCTFELELCSDGSVGMRNGDVIITGSYTRDQQVVRGELGGQSFEFDLSTARGIGAAAAVADGFWTPDAVGRWQTPEWGVTGCP